MSPLGCFREIVHDRIACVATQVSPRRPTGLYICLPARNCQELITSPATLAGLRQTALRQILAAPPTVYQDKFGRDLAWFHPVDAPATFTAMFTATTPARAIDLNWDNQAQLIGYEVLPEVAVPGQALTINFYWRSLTDQTFDARLFLQVVDSAGNPINQWEGEAFREDMYRWRPDGLLATQHTLWLGPETAPGPRPR